MALFPAYTNESAQKESPEEAYPKRGSEDDWLRNTSFKVQAQDAECSTKKTGSEYRIHSKAEAHKKKKYKKACGVEGNNTYNLITTEPPNLSVCGNFYIDRTPIKGYLSVQTLYKPACPRYHTRSFCTLGLSRQQVELNIKRYYKNKIVSDTYGETTIKTELNLFAAKIRDFNKRLAQFPKDISTWIEYANYQEKAPIKLSKTQLAERKIEILEKAIFHNATNDSLYRCYVGILESIYPSFEVSKFLEKLLIKDSTNYILWSAQINATQTSMARCIVPDVLKLYEKCMQKIYQTDQRDEIMLKLFKNCGLFLRQSGLSEQLFALMKLALELNVSADKFTKIQPKDTDQQTLIDYEEVILNSGLPMNEIWLRIEKLRQNFNFLPWPPNSLCNDPQKIVFNQDICYFIFPLSHTDNSFALTLVVLDLLKIPLFVGTSLRQQFLFKSESTSEFDAVESILVACLRQGITLTDSSNFDHIIYELVKTLTFGPSYLNTNVGYEVYLNTVMEILLLCSECFFENERRQIIFITMWLRFYRLLVLIEKLSGKLTEGYSTNIRSKVKETLKRTESRSILNFYTEFALLEYELGNAVVAENILINGLNVTSMKTQSKADVYYSYVTLAEILLREGIDNTALKILTCLALDRPVHNMDNFEVTETRKLLASKKLMQRCNETISTEKNIKTMDIEQYFLPDYFLCLLKAAMYYQILLKLNTEAIAFLQSVLQNFAEDNPRYSYIKENVYELFLSILRRSGDICGNLNQLLYNTAMNAVSDFPENVFVLKTCATLDGQPWYKVQKLFQKANTPISLFFFICFAQNRLLSVHEYNILLPETASNEIAYHIRVANVLKAATSKSSHLRKNSLIWRLYLRSLAETKKNFEYSKNALFSGLDECPWNKALYLDGSIFVPDELSHIQDLIIEKQLRIYALPEELEILRTDFEPSKASNLIE